MRTDPAVAAAAKYAPGFVVAAVARVFDPWWLVIIPLGLLAGTLAQAGRMVHDRRPWADIGNEMLVSALVGIANAILAAALIYTFKLSYLQGLVAATLCAFGGVGSIERAWRWGYGHLTNDAAAAGRRRARAQQMVNENTDADLRRLIDQIGDAERDEP